MRKLSYITNNSRSNIRNLSMSTAATVLERVFYDKLFLRMANTEVEALRSNSKERITISRLLNDLRESRNDSIVAHGMKPVSEQDAKNCLMVMGVILKSLLTTGIDFEDYPLRLTNVELVISTLESAFMK